MGLKRNLTATEIVEQVVFARRGTEFKLELLLGTLREELSLKHKYKVLFEFVMIAGVNDRRRKRLVSGET
ncbi:hypothetical protein CASFOL_029401 [Castilleja foliolosa]|uniref:Uncharacterized protein n=1 Tax=Castilleja foliolosa TaxID=1961234 RepID=A0ABD3CA85_9LAMI